MKAFDFIDIYFQQQSVENQKNFSLATEGRTKAAYAILGWLRTFYKWVAVPQVIAHYFLVKVGIRPVLISPLPKRPEPTKPQQTPEGTQANGEDTPKAQT